jgi:hypothetical protein
MKTLSFLSISVLQLLFFNSSFAQPTITVNGTYLGDQVWYADTVKITGDYTVNGTLDIFPGAYVEFQGYYAIHAERILAWGNMSDSIIFTIHDTTGFFNRSIPDGGWKGIQAEKSSFDFCRISYGKVIDPNTRFLYSTMGYMPPIWLTKFSNSVISNNFSIYALFAFGRFFFENTTIKQNVYETFSNSQVLQVNDCLVKQNKGGFSTEIAYVTTSRFEDNTDLKLSGTGGENDIVKISNSVLKFNNGLKIGSNSRFPGAGVLLTNSEIMHNRDVYINANGGGTEEYIGNLIVNNVFLEGLHLYGFHNGTFKVVNNTICNNRIVKNEAMVTVKEASAAKFCNNILFGNKTMDGGRVQLGFATEPLAIDIMNNDIEGGLDPLLNPSITGIHENNIGGDPRFANPANFDFRLTRNSTCINTGTVITTGLGLPEIDLGGNPRITGQYIDIGAYEYRAAKHRCCCLCWGKCRTSSQIKEM